ncbi:MAG: MgtC/SapB family protein [Bacillota bacterium]
MILATLLGGLVGWERENHSRPAGFRTNILVCLGSALIMIVSIELYNFFQASRVNDPGRIAAQVVSGIGFLGAGTIIREGFTVKGLTTAAGLWAIAGVGLAAGAGFYFSSISATVLIILTLTTLNSIEQSVNQSGDIKNLKIRAADRPGELGRICSILGDYDIHIFDISIDHILSEEDIYINLHIRISSKVNFDQLLEELTEMHGINQVEVQKN